MAQAHEERNIALHERLRVRGDDGDEFAALLARAAAFEIVDYELAVSGQLSKSEHRRMMDLAPEASEGYLRACQELIDLTLSELQGLNPFPFLAQAYVLNSVQVGDYFEPTSHQSETRIELAVALCAAVNVGGTQAREPEWHELRTFLDGLEEIFELARLGNLASTFAATAAGESNAEIRFDATAHHLAVRGMCYAQHGVALAEELYGELSDVMRARLGFNSNDIATFATRVHAEMEKRFEALTDRAFEQGAWLVRRAKTDSALRELLGQSDEDNIQAKATMWALFSGLEEALTFTIDEGVAWTGLPEERVRAILETFSIPLGEGAFDKPHPLGRSPAPDFPIARFLDRYLIALGGRMERELPLLLDKHVRPISRRLARRKDRVVTSLTLEFLSNMLPGCKTYSSVHYRVTEEGKQKRREMDGLAVFDRCLFLVETKPGSLSPQAESGADVKRLLSELEDNTVAALEQAQRGRKFILDNETATFEDDRGESLVTIKRSDYDHIFIVTPTLYSLGDHGPQLPRLRSVGMFQQGECPFSVYINDLRVISESVRNPAEFVHYLRWRAKLPLGERVRVADELDLYATFLLREQSERRLQTTNGWMSALGSTTDFDDYYLRVPEGRRRKEPPRMFHSVTPLRQFIDRLSRDRPPGWLDAAGTCLELSIPELAALGLMLKAFPDLPADMATANAVTSRDVDDELDESAISLGVVYLGKDVEWREAWPHAQRDLEGIHRVLFCRLSQKGNRLITWALTTGPFRP